VKVAAYQAPLLDAGSMDALGLIRTRVAWCEAEGVSVLCCPEAILGGLADNSSGDPMRFAIGVQDGRLDAMLAPLASDRVTTIVGFTERTADGRLYNAAAVFQRGAVAGVYRKLYPAINRSVYDAGREVPVFQVGALTFGIVICNDSNYFEPARLMAARGAAALFVPTNNSLPPKRASADLVAQARSVDIARAVDNSVWVVRADVAGRTGTLVSYGASGIVDPDGTVVQSARQMTEDLIVAEIDPTPRARRRGWDASRNRDVIDQYAALIAASSAAPADRG
jgi:predicted amidohydrolase